MIESLLRAALADLPPPARTAQVRRDGWWLRLEPTRPGPSQGWKLHVSSTVPCAAAVLRAALPVLLRRPTRFKVTATVEHLRRLNANDAPIEQVGKFITVYPDSDRESVRLARELDAATTGLRGPAVRTDRPVRPGSLVHYRFGGFRPRFVRTALGPVVPAVETPDGELEPDLRVAPYRPPPWVEDPFLASSAEEVGGERPLLNDRYRPARVLLDSPRGCVIDAVDVPTGRRQILKSARRDALADDDGRDARDRLAAEESMLRAVAGLRRPEGGPIAPCVVGLFREQDEDYLVLEHVPGRTLHEVISGLTSRGLLPTDDDVVRWGSAAAATTAALHRLGVVHRDLTARNFIEEPSGTLRLIDFELAWSAGSARVPSGRGSPGSMSPQQAAGELASAADDVYALGALLYYAATGTDPARAPRPHDLLAQPPPAVDPASARARIVQVIGRALAPDPRMRYPSADALGRALSGRACDAPALPAPEPATCGHDCIAGAAHSCAGLLRRQVLATVGNGGVELDTPLGLDTGLAGVVLGLCAAVGAWGDARDRSALATAAAALVDGHRRQGQLAGAAAAGLYTGEAGIGVALMTAAAVLDDDGLLAAAERVTRELPGRPAGCPDVFSGLAGRARAHVWAWRLTGASAQRQAALDAGSALLAGAAGGLWTGPADHGHLPGRPFLGYARGAAGVADVLLDLYELSDDDRLLRAASRTAQVLATAAERAGRVDGTPDGSVQWPVAPGGPFFGPYWCHGAAGIGQFLLHAGAHRAAAGDLVRPAAESVTAARWAGPGQCHGLAGSIEFLLDVYQRTGDVEHLTRARELGGLLLPFLPDPDGEDRAMPSGYMFGPAGVLAALLRLADPGHRPRQLAGEGPTAPAWRRPLP